MDPLTHTLFGANLAATRLSNTTRLATAALVIGANFPDVDAVLYFTPYEDLALGCRRGWTHGVLALVVLPFALTALLLLYDRLRPHPDRRASARWLLLLSTLGVLTHPTLDWLNNYGMRWLMPFDGTWFYGDSVFIMDPWLWLTLGVGWLAARRPTKALLVTWATIFVVLAWFVGRRSPGYLVVVAIIGLVLLAALVWRPKREPLQFRYAFALGALVVASVYIALRIGINQATERVVTRELLARSITPVERLMASPHPIDPLRWEIVAETGDVYRYGRYRWNDGILQLSDEEVPVPRETPEWEAARSDPSIEGFMTWVRFPAYEIERTENATRVYVWDMRYASRGGRSGFGTRVVTLPAE